MLRFGLLKARDEDMYEWLLQYIDHNQVKNLDMIMGGGGGSYKNEAKITNY